jgi:hypothetical protein
MEKYVSKFTQIAKKNFFIWFYTSKTNNIFLNVIYLLRKQH